MQPLNQEQLKRLQEKAFPIFEYLQRKDALELVRQLEKLAPGLAPTNPGIQKEFQKLIAQLKWVACPIIQNDQEFFDLIKNHLLEGLELDVDLSDLVTDKIALQFGIDERESFSGVVSAIRANEQEIGSQPITIQGQTLSVRPSIKNWLLDFIKSTASQYPTKMEESNYLFSNPNAKNLSEKEKTILGKVLDFYDNFKTVADQWAIEEREGQIVSPPAERPAPSPTPGPSPPPVEKPATWKPSFQEEARLPPTPPAPPAAPPPAPPPPESKDVYKEPISQEDVAGPPGARRVEPRIQGNIVDLKGKRDEE